MALALRCRLSPRYAMISRIVRPGSCPRWSVQPGACSRIVRSRAAVNARHCLVRSSMRAIIACSPERRSRAGSGRLRAVGRISMPFRLSSPGADDIFISYSRRDANTYAVGLADALTRRGFFCFFDRLGTEANADLPPSLIATIRRCTMLVVVGSPAARESGPSAGAACSICCASMRVSERLAAHAVPWRSNDRGHDPRRRLRTSRRPQHRNPMITAPRSQWQ